MVLQPLSKGANALRTETTARPVREETRDARARERASERGSAGARGLDEEEAVARTQPAAHAAAAGPMIRRALQLCLPARYPLPQPQCGRQRAYRSRLVRVSSSTSHVARADAPSAPKLLPLTGKEQARREERARRERTPSGRKRVARRSVASLPAPRPSLPIAACEPPLYRRACAYERQRLVSELLSVSQLANAVTPSTPSALELAAQRQEGRKRGTRTQGEWAGRPAARRQAVRMRMRQLPGYLRSRSVSEVCSRHWVRAATPSATRPMSLVGGPERWEGGGTAGTSGSRGRSAIGRL